MCLIHIAVDDYIRYLEDIEKAYETIKGYRSELVSLCRYLVEKYNGPVYLNEICIRDLEEYLLHLKDKGYKPVSRNRTMYIMRSFYKYCCKKKLAGHNIANELEIIPEPVKERIFLSSGEMKVLIASIKEPLARLIVATLFYTGMRISECLGLEPEDVDLVNGIISVRNTKNRVERNIPIHRKLIPLLKEYSTSGGRKYFFTHGTHGTRGSRGVSADYINKVLRDTVQRLKWSKKVTCHIIRHSFASSLVQKNVNIVSIQKLLGHSNLSTTSVYTHTNMKNLQNVINTIDNAI